MLPCQPSLMIPCSNRQLARLRCSLPTTGYIKGRVVPLPHGSCHLLRRVHTVRVLAEGSSEANPLSGPSESSSGAKRETLKTLDYLLGSTDEASEDTKPNQDEKLVQWWSIKPKQSAPPRQTAMSPGKQGRFIMNEDYLGELRTGIATEAGADVGLPRSTPIASWVTMAVCIIVYGTYINVVASQGPESGYDFLSPLVNDHHQLLDQGQVWRLPLSLLVHSSALQLAASLWGLATIAPEAEAVFGYSTYIAIFLLSGLSGEAASLVLDPAATSFGPAGCLAGLAAALQVHQGLSSGARNAATAAAAAPSSTLAQDLAEFAAITGMRNSMDSSSSGGGSSSSSSSSGVEQANASGAGSRTDAASSSSSTSSQRAAAAALQQQGPGLPALALHSVGCLGLALLASQLSQGDQEYQVLQQLQPLSLVAGALAGGVLAAGMGPTYQVSREPDIPVGSMVIPQDVREIVVVVDTRSNAQRALVAAAFAALLLAAFSFGVSGLAR